MEPKPGPMTMARTAEVRPQQHWAEGLAREIAQRRDHARDASELQAAQQRALIAGGRPVTVSPFSRSCAVAGCASPVTRGGRCHAHGRQADQTRGLTSDRRHRHLYNSGRWARTRAAILALHPLCECDDCRQTGAVRLATVVHHRRAHRGDPILFFDWSNLQARAKTCHDRITGRTRGVEISTASPAPKTGAQCRARNSGFP